VAVLGWCFGGGMALEAAISQPKALDGAVIYYGSVDRASREDLQPVDVPILGLFGAEDQGIPVADVRAFESTLQDLGKDVEIHVYEDAGHAFANPSGTRYNAEAASDAWDETTTFLNRVLYEPLNPES
jgi:carboxymethylenebutenolidase